MFIANAILFGVIFTIVSHVLSKDEERPFLKLISIRFRAFSILFTSIALIFAAIQFSFIVRFVSLENANVVMFVSMPSSTTCIYSVNHVVYTH